MTDPAATSFVGPDGAEYEYADPASSPSMDDVDSTEVPPVAGAPEHVDPAGLGESTPPAGG